MTERKDDGLLSQLRTELGQVATELREETIDDLLARLPDISFITLEMSIKRGVWDCLIQLPKKVKGERMIGGMGVTPHDAIRDVLRQIEEGKE